MKRRVIGFIFTIVLCCSFLFGCGEKSYELPYYDLMDGEIGYDKSTFYINDLTTGGADPGIIEITDPEDPDYGWFYLYVTGSTTIPVYRSRDMSSWEIVGQAFIPEEGSSATIKIWAPECIYDEATDKYYLFFSAGDGLFYAKSSDGLYFSFESYEDKERFYSYYDPIAEIYPVLTSGSPSATALANLKQDLDFRIELIREIGTNNLIPDDINGNGCVISEQVLQEIEDTYNDLQNYSGLFMYYKMRDLLIKSYLPDVTPIKTELSYSLHVAVSDSPRGPFYQYTNEEGKVNKGTGENFDPSNRTMPISRPFVAQEDIYKWVKYNRSEYYRGIDSEFYIDENGEKQPCMMVGETGAGLMAEFACEMIDVSPFVDPKTGDKYLYFIRGPHKPSGSRDTFVLGVKIGDKNSKWTDDPKWETVTRLTRTGYYTTDNIEKDNASRIDLNEGTTNEGPFVYYDKNSDQYFLTVSVNVFDSPKYAVIQAISDSPLGPFRKLHSSNGGYLLSSAGFDHVSGPGHHSFINYKGNLYMVYHSHVDTQTGTGTRLTAVDPVVFVENNDGDTIMHLNGPTRAFMPVVGPDAQYTNIAKDAKIKASNVGKGSSADYLNDSVISIFDRDYIKEFETGEKKKTEIKLTFDEYRTISAVMVFNSINYEYFFKKVDRIEFDFKRTLTNGKEEKGIAYINNLEFDVNRHVYIVDEDIGSMRPGGSAIAQFNEIQVKEIRLTFKSDTKIAISEIFVLGK